MATRAAPRRFWTWPAVAVATALLALFAAANLHLVNVATGSQPDCVLQPETPEGGAASLRAARPSC